MNAAPDESEVLDLDLTQPADLGLPEVITLPDHLLEDGWVIDETSAQHICGVWITRPDRPTCRRLLPWIEVKHPSQWGLL